MAKPLLHISKLTNVSRPKIPGFFVISTAPVNVEGDYLPAHKEQVAFVPRTELQEENHLNTIAELIFKASLTCPKNKLDYPEIIISTNGFSSSKSSTQERFEEIYSYINQDECTQLNKRAKNIIFIGYRWTSEPLVGGSSWWWEKLVHAVTALPILPRVILVFGVISILLSLFLRPKPLLVLTPFSFIVSILILILTTLFFAVVTLVLLRLSIYFRDVYRATNFGVPDLVELIRQLDKMLLNKAKEQYLPNNRLVDKLKNVCFESLKSDLLSTETNNPKQEELIVRIICDKVVENYCKGKSVEEIDFESLETQEVKISENIVQQQQVDKIIKITEKVIEQNTDKEFVKLREKAVEILENKAKKYWKEHNRVKLTFIGHSLGGYVVTSAVRILSDVFDLNSVGTLELTDKLPTPDIGNVFSLERLVLVSPDIPIVTILSGRANFLRSSIRRFKETYLFSNEGDLALRLASTVANYFSFPARTRESGYRLGNVAIRNNLGYGIVNSNSGYQEQRSTLLQLLTIDSLNSRNSLAQLQSYYQVDEMENREHIAELFSYLDFTDYTDTTVKPSRKKRRVLTLAQWRWEPRWFYYLRLIFAYALGIVDTHGGYFQGELSQQIMYRLAFLGFGGFLDSLNQESRQSALNLFSQECRQKKIQVILSPERYQVDILGSDRKQIRRKILNSPKGLS